MEPLPSYSELKRLIPLSLSQSSFIEQSRQTITKILSGADQRLLLIVGPCSIHDPLSAKEYAAKLKDLATSVSDQFYIAMRVYCEKPRTSTGWKGLLYDPLLDGSNQIRLGIEKTRQLLYELAELGVPAATEFLDPLTAFYYDDLVSWGSIGARTSTSQTHRQLASSLSMPIGFKNGIAGNVSAAIDGVVASSHSHTYLGINEQGVKSVIQSKGNSQSHIVLRGGESGPNYDPFSVSEATLKLEQANLNPHLVIDCSHHNSNKEYFHQTAVFQSVLQQIIEGNTNIRGLMVESQLFAGSQTLTCHPKDLKYGVSVTDSCLDWQSTSQLIQWGAQRYLEYYLKAEAILTN